ncbi:MAG: choice-of-anchor B family protein [Saprospiraceae bacterium]|nr:choice-of-anchor B family protein [Saprospiraceae bacterium]
MKLKSQAFALFIFLIGLGPFQNGISQQNLNTELVVNHLLTDDRYSGSWVYVDEFEREYALLGAKTGTAVIEIIGQDSSFLRGFIPGPASNWREITSLGDFAFVTTEGADSIGMQVIDLSPLPQDSPVLVTQFVEQFDRAHIIQRDVYSEDPYVYVIGTQTSQGVHIIDVQDPENPVQIGLYEPGYYIHDAHVKGDKMFCAAFYEAKMDIVDISDKTNPTLIASIEDPGVNTHSSWLTEDDKYLIVTDEADGFPSRIWNIEDLENIFEVSTYSANLESLVHNPYIKGDFAFISHNTEGLRIVDLVDPRYPVEVGYYDTYNGPSGGFSGLWSACPFLPSGKIVGGDRTRGLFVWDFNETFAGRIYGRVEDASTGNLLPDALIETQIAGLDTLIQVDENGEFVLAFYPQWIFVEVSAPGYESRTENIDLSVGGSENIIFQLDLISSVSNSGGSDPILFPNPGGDWISISKLTEGNPSISVVDVFGKTWPTNYSFKSDQISVDISKLPGGLYFLIIHERKPLSFCKQ